MCFYFCKSQIWLQLTQLRRQLKTAHWTGHDIGDSFTSSSSTTFTCSARRAACTMWFSWRYCSAEATWDKKVAMMVFSQRPLRTNSFRFPRGLLTEIWVPEKILTKQTRRTIPFFGKYQLNQQTAKNHTAHTFTKVNEMTQTLLALWLVNRVAKHVTYSTGDHLVPDMAELRES